MKRTRTIYTKLITALLEHGLFRAEHYPQYLVFFGGFSLTLMNHKINFAVCFLLLIIWRVIEHVVDIDGDDVRCWDVRCETKKRTLDDSDDSY